MNGISCPTATFCAAVGGGNQNLIETWNGFDWSITPSPSAPSTSTASGLVGVSCTSPSFCMAVGGFSVNTIAGQLAMVWDGSSWNLVPTPDSGSTNVYPYSVSCVSASVCTAVGEEQAEGSAVGFGFIETWNGGVWSVGEPAEPSGATQSELSSVSCSGPSYCAAVGDYETSDSEGILIEIWSNNTWIVIPAPSSLDGQRGGLRSVSCSSPASCGAVGSISFGGGTADLVVQWVGTTVTSVQMPPSGSGGGLLNGVDCWSPTACVAVGADFTQPSFEGDQNQVLTMEGSTLTSQPVPTAGIDDGLNSVACVIGSMCAAVGFTRPSGALNQTSILTASIAPPGYLEVARDGGIFAFGGAPYEGSMGGQPLDAPIVGVAEMPDGGGYWEVASDGGIFAFGDATFYGSMGGKPLNAPIAGIAVTPTGNGYFEVASDGGLFAFGDATFDGSMGGTPLNAPIVGIGVTASGGYDEVASDGGIFAFGGAPFHGSEGGKPLNAPIVGLGVTPTGGYYEVASDGGIFAFGAPFFGSMGGEPLTSPLVGMAVSTTGYYEVAADGGLFAYGAPFGGSMGGQRLNAPITGVTA